MGRITYIPVSPIATTQSLAGKGGETRHDTSLLRKGSLSLGEGGGRGFSDVAAKNGLQILLFTTVELQIQQNEEALPGGSASPLFIFNFLFLIHVRTVGAKHVLPLP